MSARLASVRRAAGAFLLEELRAHPWIAPGLALTASAALGSNLSAIAAIVRGWLS